EIGEHQVSAGFGQRQGHRPAHALRGAGNQGHPAAEIEQVTHAGSPLLSDYRCTPLTILGRAAPRVARATAPATVSRTLRACLALVEATCADSTTLSMWRSGQSGGIGSGSKTSKAAAARWLLWSASSSAAESTTSPRLTLIRMAPGRIWPIVARFISR